MFRTSTELGLDDCALSNALEAVSLLSRKTPTEKKCAVSVSHRGPCFSLSA